MNNFEVEISIQIRDFEMDLSKSRSLIDRAELKFLTQSIIRNK